MRFLRSLGVQKVFKIQKLPPESSVTKYALSLMFKPVLELRM